MKKSAIVSQVHIPDYDVQGSLYPADKQEIVDTSISHLRKHNPDSYIILCGHGHKPYDSTLNQCDYVYWEEKCRPLNIHGLVIGMPAQFYFVSIGIKHALSLGFKRVLKTRTDCVIGRKNIVEACEKILQEESKNILITQQTGINPYKFGDCFMYGDIELIDKIWDLNNPVLWQEDGLVNTGMNFCKLFGEVKHFDNTERWQELLRSNCAFRNITWIMFMCLRWNFNRLANWQVVKEQIIGGDFDYNSCYFGRVNGWHAFNEHDEDTVPNGFFDQKSYYNLVNVSSKVTLD